MFLFLISSEFVVNSTLKVGSKLVQNGLQLQVPKCVQKKAQNEFRTELEMTSELVCLYWS